LDLPENWVTTLKMGARTKDYKMTLFEKFFLIRDAIEVAMESRPLWKEDLISTSFEQHIKVDRT
jgi:hypothetical protein